VGAVWVRLGPRGSVWCGGNDEPVWFPPIPSDVVDVTGAGDSMDGAFVHARWWGASELEAVRFAHGSAALTVASEFTVRPDLRSALVASTAGVPDPKEYS
jgi:pseudouridine kinase